MNEYARLKQLIKQQGLLDQYATFLQRNSALSPSGERSATRGNILKCIILSCGWKRNEKG
jgi:hypothetical protein